MGNGGLRLAAILLTIVTVILAIAVAVLAALLIREVKREKDRNVDPTPPPPPTEEPSPEECLAPANWKTDACCNRQCSKNWDPKPVLLVSLDGFKSDYLKRNRTESIQRLINCGVHAPFMYPSYPSKTFPNHYTIVTGLYPETHGIIDNYMFDPSITPRSDREFRLGRPSSLNPQWWHGEPVGDELELVDSLIGGLMNQLFQNNLLHCVNIIILADHGMQKLKQRDEILLDDYFNTTGMRLFPGPVGRVMLSNSSWSSDQVVDSLACKSSAFNAYRKRELPARLHYTRSARIGDVVVDADPGYRVFGKGQYYEMKGDHGYDFRDDAMHALFLAHGPGFKRRFTTVPFENIELFNMFSDLLDIPMNKRPPNNGTMGSLSHLLREKTTYGVSRATPIPKCYELPKNAQGCECVDQTLSDTSCKSKLRSLAWLNQEPSKSSNCLLQSCTFTGIDDHTMGYTRMVEGILSADQSIWSPSPADKACSFIFDSWTSCSKLANIRKGLAAKNMSLVPMFGFASSALVRNSSLSLLYQTSPMFDDFQKGMWRELMELALSYAKSYKSVLLAAGPIFDHDSDGVADPDQLHYRLNQDLPPIPTAYYQVLVRCRGGFTGEGTCVNPESAEVLSFVLPHRERPVNCQSVKDYLYTHTARVRDVELLTGLEFFADRESWPLEHALRLRTHINQNLWGV